MSSEGTALCFAALCRGDVPFLAGISFSVVALGFVSLPLLGVAFTLDDIGNIDEAVRSADCTFAVALVALVTVLCCAAPFGFAVLRCLLALRGFL